MIESIINFVFYIIKFPDNIKSHPSIFLYGFIVSIALSSLVCPIDYFYRTIIKKWSNFIFIAVGHSFSYYTTIMLWPHVKNKILFAPIIITILLVFYFLFLFIQFALITTIVKRINIIEFVSVKMSAFNALISFMGILHFIFILLSLYQPASSGIGAIYAITVFPLFIIYSIIQFIVFFTDLRKICSVP